MKQDLRKAIRRVYYDWANDPEFERIEKYPNDKTVDDSFIRLFLSFAKECLPEKKNMTLRNTTMIELIRQYQMQGFNNCLDKTRENINGLKSQAKDD
jgi:hypothetical protein